MVGPGEQPNQSALDAEILARAENFAGFVADTEEALRSYMSRAVDLKNGARDKLEIRRDEHGTGLVHAIANPDSSRIWHEGYIDNGVGTLTFIKRVDRPNKSSVAVSATWSKTGQEHTGKLSDSPFYWLPPNHEEPIELPQMLFVTHHVLADLAQALDFREMVVSQERSPKQSVAARVAEILNFGRQLYVD